MYNVDITPAQLISLQAEDIANDDQWLKHFESKMKARFVEDMTCSLFNFYTDIAKESIEYRKYGIQCQ